MVGEGWRSELDDRLAVWQGPPPYDLAKHPTMLLTLAREAGADTVVLDSLKDAAIGLADDEVGAGYNRARQTAIVGGVQVIELHHSRKISSAGRTGKPGIDELYGSTWLTSGAGSVILLTGAPGDPIVNLAHLKQPGAEVGPFKVIHDHDAGRSTIWHATDLLAVATAAKSGLTAFDAARLLFEVEKPTTAEKEKARRKLEKLTRQGVLRLIREGDKTVNLTAA